MAARLAGCCTAGAHQVVPLLKVHVAPVADLNLALQLRHVRKGSKVLIVHCGVGCMDAACVGGGQGKGHKEPGSSAKTPAEAARSRGLCQAAAAGHTADGLEREGLGVLVGAVLQGAAALLGGRHVGEGGHGAGARHDLRAQEEARRAAGRAVGPCGLGNAAWQGSATVQAPYPPPGCAAAAPAGRPPLCSASPRGRGWPAARCPGTPHAAARSA